MGSIAAPEIQTNEALLLKFFDAFKRRDIPTLLDLVTDDVVLESAFGTEPEGRSFRGKQEFGDGLRRYFDTFEGATSSDRTYVMAGESAYTEVTVKYPSHPGPMRVCDIYEFRGGKVSAKRAYGKRGSA